MRSDLMWVNSDPRYSLHDKDDFEKLNTISLTHYVWPQNFPELMPPL